MASLYLYTIVGPGHPNQLAMTITEVALLCLQCAAVFDGGRGGDSSLVYKRFCNFACVMLYGLNVRS